MRRLISYLTLLALFISPAGCRKTPAYIHNEGMIFGTVYSIKYESPDGKDLKEGIEAVLYMINRSLSTFDSTSVISLINKNIDTPLDSYFTTVFNKAMEVSAVSNGAFDITVAPLVNAWGFGFKRKDNITPALIDSLLRFVGYDKVKLDRGRVVKKHPSVMLDCSAIAKGYASDRVGEYLASQGCNNYMVNIGGEVVAHGRNSQGQYWRLGVNRPSDAAFPITRNMKAIVELKDNALATSGNYLNFYIEGGKKYAHTIDPHTGYPVQHNLLSATVLADDCMTADAFATVFMVSGLEKSIEIVQLIDDIEVYLIYCDEEGNYKTYASEGFAPLIIREME